MDIIIHNISNQLRNNHSAFLKIPAMLEAANKSAHSDITDNRLPLQICEIQTNQGRRSHCKTAQNLTTNHYEQKQYATVTERGSKGGDVAINIGSRNGWLSVGTAMNESNRRVESSEKTIQERRERKRFVTAGGDVVGFTLLSVQERWFLFFFFFLENGFFVFGVFAFCEWK